MREIQIKGGAYMIGPCSEGMQICKLGGERIVIPWQRVNEIMQEVCVTR